MCPEPDPSGLHNAGIKNVSNEAFQIRSAESLALDLQRPYIVKGLLAPGDLSVVYGEPGSAKTFLALHIAYMVSMLWPVFRKRVRGGSTLYFALEGHAGFERRVAAHIKKWARSASFFYVTDNIDLYSDEGDAEAVVEAAKACDADLIVIDTLSRCFGSGSENDSADMGWMIKAFDFIRRETGAHVMLVHHSGKDSSRGMRGHSSLLAAVDVSLEVTRDGDDTRLVHVRKVKDGTDGETFPFRLEVVDLGKDEDGDFVTSCVLIESECGTAAERSLTKSQRGWLEDLKGIFSEDKQGELVTPLPGMVPVRALTRDVIREGLTKRGRFKPNTDGTMTGKDRERLRAALKRLKDKQKIGLTDRFVWITETFLPDARLTKT